MMLLPSLMSIEQLSLVSRSKQCKPVMLWISEVVDPAKLVQPRTGILEQCTLEADSRAHLKRQETGEVMSREVTRQSFENLNIMD